LSVCVWCLFVCWFNNEKYEIRLIMHGIKNFKILGLTFPPICRNYILLELPPDTKCVLWLFYCIWIRVFRRFILKMACEDSLTAERALLNLLSVGSYLISCAFQMPFYSKRNVLCISFCPLIQTYRSQHLFLCSTLDAGSKCYF
jgi:hypothetical protein